MVGVLWHAASAEEEEVYFGVVQKAFNDLGYIEGKNIVLEQRYPAENPDQSRSLAREIVDAKPDAIISVQALGTLELKKLQTPFQLYLFLWRTQSVSDSSRVWRGRAVTLLGRR